MKIRTALTEPSKSDVACVRKRTFGHGSVSAQKRNEPEIPGVGGSWPPTLPAAPKACRHPC